ncbi:sporulation protein YabP [Iocasia frigidifontis]|uniref:Sporulation protein YabP n=1 Tax=Iocasia fonsfrigidae TaxID=2682810 RepID=A0A8A7KDN3_9FIRM|nr:sporulation protein YabP [Iocasia fonsfrigidae]QTL99370.1 sporulation protein YabP [Iocasia fonsfrigidae]
MKNQQDTGKENIAAHSFSLNNRKQLNMTGVKEVVTFNENKVILQTTQGNLSIKGEDLNIHNLNLDDGSVKIEGYVSSLEYTDKINSKGLLNKLFK